MADINLNEILVPCADGPDYRQEDNGIESISKIEVIFRNHRQKLITEIMKYPVIIGCVAWLTDYEILRALASRKMVKIVVQKEDFLKPDSKGNNSKLREFYGFLPRTGKSDIRFLNSISYCAGGDIDPIRCVGNHNSTKKPAWPRMHNKFLIFCDLQAVEEVDGWTQDEIIPEKVWTGSYNISDNATKSWENSILIDDPAIAEAYAKEFAQIYVFSEPLDWESKWVEPEYRIGS